MQLTQFLTFRGTQLVMLGVDNSGRNWYTWSRHFGAQLIQFPDRGAQLVLPLLQRLDCFHPPPPLHGQLLPWAWFKCRDTTTLQRHPVYKYHCFGCIWYGISYNHLKTATAYRSSILTHHHWSINLWASLDLVFIFLGETNRRFFYVIMSGGSSYNSPVILIQHLHSL